MPSNKAYKREPEGYWTWGSIGPAGIAYNPTTVAADEAPKTWEEVLDPKWASAVTVEVSNSRLQHVSWYMLRQHAIRDAAPPPGRTADQPVAAAVAGGLARLSVEPPEFAREWDRLTRMR